MADKPKRRCANAKETLSVVVQRLADGKTHSAIITASARLRERLGWSPGEPCAVRVAGKRSLVILRGEGPQRLMTDTSDATLSAAFKSHLETFPLPGERPTLRIACASWRIEGDALHAELPEGFALRSCAAR